jgi:hypothetical protein
MERYFRALQEYMNEVPSFWNGGTASMDSLDDDPVTGDFGVDTGSNQRGGRDDNDNDDRARREAEEAARKEAERLAAEIARIEAEEAARFEAEMEAEAARQEAREAEEARLSSPESLTDDQLDEAIAAYSNADTAVASEVLGRLVEEKEIRTAEKAEEEVDGGVDDFNEGATTPVYQGPTITGETTYIDEEAISDVRGIVNDRLFGEGTSERDDVYAPRISALRCH